MMYFQSFTRQGESLGAIAKNAKEAIKIVAKATREYPECIRVVPVNAKISRRTFYI